MFRSYYNNRPRPSMGNRVGSSLLVAIAFSAAVIAPANAQLVRAYVVEDSITVGDRFTLVVVAERAQDDSVEFPSFWDESENDSTTNNPAAGQALATAGLPNPVQLGDILILRELGSGSKLLRFGTHPLADTMAYEATTFALDTAMVAPIGVNVTTSRGIFARQSEAFPVFVSSVIEPDAQTIRDLAPLRDFPKSYLTLILTALGLIAGFIFVRWFLRRKPEPVVLPEPIKPEVPVESPLAEANRRLAALEDADLSKEEAIKPFFVELTETLRNYLERRLRILALESTSSELLVLLKGVLPKDAEPEGLIEDIGSVLETSDLAKFADVKHNEKISSTALAETRVLLMRIEETLRPRRQAPVPPPTDITTNGRSSDGGTDSVEKPEQESQSDSNLEQAVDIQEAAPAGEPSNPDTSDASWSGEENTGENMEAPETPPAEPKEKPADKPGPKSIKPMEPKRSEWEPAPPSDSNASGAKTNGVNDD